MNCEYCIDCGRELIDYTTHTLHFCIICENKIGSETFVFEKLNVKEKQFSSSSGR